MDNLTSCQRFVETYQRLVPALPPIASPSVNNPSQLDFGFLDKSYPILDNLNGGAMSIEMEDIHEIEDIHDSEDHMKAVRLKIAFALMQKLNNILTPPTYHGKRYVLPIDHLESKKVLSGLKILDISSDARAVKRLTKLGAEAKLLSPYPKTKTRSGNEITEQIRKEWADQLIDQVRKQTWLGHDDLVFADRSTLYWVLATEADSELLYQSRETEEVIKTISSENYRKVAALGRTGAELDIAVEAFVKKNPRKLKSFNKN